MKSAAVVLAVALAVGTPVFAQSTMTLDTFVTQANRIPMNPLAAVRPDARRLVGVAGRAFDAVRSEIRAARAAGRTPAACPPERIRLNPRQLLDFLNTIPQPRRARMTPTDGIREWMAHSYPCPQA